jgi:hypothetical protein
MQLSTERRAKEREEFNRQVREKEQERERELARRQKLEEEEEEREVQELRRKAIPRAHEVPEWYKEAPKRKTKGV